MKKAVYFMIILFIPICLISCQLNQPRIIYPSNRFSTVFGEFTLHFPEEWRGNYALIQENADLISVFHIKTRNISAERGTLFYVNRVNRFSEEDRNEFEKESSDTRIIFETAEYTYILSMPTDIQYLTPVDFRVKKQKSDFRVKKQNCIDKQKQL